MPLPPRFDKALPPLYLARHAETVFNRAGRLQGQHGHSPLTRTGIAQAEAMATAIANYLGPHPTIRFCCSTAGRTQQTAAIICDALPYDFFDIDLDARLQEIDVGDWAGRTYAEISAATEPIMDVGRRLFAVRPPGGEWYDDMAARLCDWCEQQAGGSRPLLVISHGIAARVLRGLLLGGEDIDGTAIAADLPQGTLMRIDKGQEIPIITGHQPLIPVGDI